MTICDHWSYTGIGWQLGVESDVLSVEDAMNLYDRAGVKTCIELDPRAYEKMEASFPEVIQRLKGYLKTGKLEIVGAAYGQPMGTMFSGESNIRQICYGVQTIEKALDYRPTTFLEEEEFTHPQLPQILKSAGYKYASLNQLDTWGRAGVPVVQTDALNWQGRDGTVIPATPENSLFRVPLDPNDELKNWAATSSSPEFKKLQDQGKPMFVGWAEFGWESPSTPAYDTDAAAYKKLAENAPIEYVTLTEYMDKYGKSPKSTEAFKMDDWNKCLTWGLGGDQLRIYNNKVEGTLLAAERFDAVASALGKESKAAVLDTAWKDLLASQSHDVGLCEYSRWQQDRMAPLDRVEDHHNFTWGALGYNLLDTAQRRGEGELKAALAYIVAQTRGPSLRQGRSAILLSPTTEGARSPVSCGRPKLAADLVKPSSQAPLLGEKSVRNEPVEGSRAADLYKGHPTRSKAQNLCVSAPPRENSKKPKSDARPQGPPLLCTVFNPCAWSRTDVVSTGRLYPIPKGTRDIQVLDSSGHAVPCQLIEPKRNPDGTLLVAKVSFLAKDVPSVGYDSYSLQFSPGQVTAQSDLKTSKGELAIENAFVRIKVDPKSGAISSLVDKKTGKEMLNPNVSEFPTFKGQPDPGYPLHRNIPAEYDSSKGGADVAWEQAGPVTASIRATYRFSHLLYETHVSLSAGMPYAEVTTRILSEVPPRRDDDPKDIKRGYWLSFAPSFKPEKVLRDYPLAMEPTEKQQFHALSYVDLVGKDSGLLILHPGTQFFRFEPNGAFSNLVMREWESYYSSEWGWPRYAEYSHALEPHAANFSNSQRVREATDFTQKLIPVLTAKPGNGKLPSRMSFLSVSPAGAELTEFRREAAGGYELRLTETDGSPENAKVKFAMPIRGAEETTILGKTQASAPMASGEVKVKLQPWKFQTLKMK